MPQAQGGITTWGLLPREFTFGEPQSTAKNIKQAGGLFYESKVTDNWLLRIGGTLSFWDHWVEDVIPSPGMALNNHEMLRLWRTIENIDRYGVAAIDSTYSFKLLGGQHRLFTVVQTQNRNLYQEQFNQNNNRQIPALDIYNPVHAPYDPFDKVRANRQPAHAELWVRREGPRQVFRREAADRRRPALRQIPQPNRQRNHRGTRPPQRGPDLDLQLRRGVQADEVVCSLLWAL